MADFQLLGSTVCKPWAAMHSCLRTKSPQQSNSSTTLPRSTASILSRWGSNISTSSFRPCNLPGHEVNSITTAITRTSPTMPMRSEEHTSELQSRGHLVCRLLLEQKNNQTCEQNSGGDDQKRTHLTATHLYV